MFALIGMKFIFNFNCYHFWCYPYLNDCINRYTFMNTVPRLNPMIFLSNQGPLLLIWFTLFPAWISNHMPSKVWDEITYPFLNFNCCTMVWYISYIAILKKYDDTYAILGKLERAHYTMAASSCQPTRSWNTINLSLVVYASQCL